MQGHGGTGSMSRQSSRWDSARSETQLGLLKGGAPAQATLDDPVPSQG